MPLQHSNTDKSRTSKWGLSLCTVEVKIIDSTSHAERRLEASLVASTFVENQFLLIGSGPSSPVSACDPDQDPVIMAVAFSKSHGGQRIVTVLLPGGDLPSCLQTICSVLPCFLNAFLMEDSLAQ